MRRETLLLSVVALVGWLAAPAGARPEARSVMVHESENGFMVSCADLH